MSNREPHVIQTTGDHPPSGEVRTHQEPAALTRREIIRGGVRLVFVVPVLSTFFAHDAIAAGSRHSCYPTGHACPGAEPCCDGPCAINVCP
jgi:hypothetical protein